MKKNSLPLLCLLLTLTNLLACSSGGGSDDDAFTSNNPDASAPDPSTPSGSNARLSLATYNTGLLPFFTDLADQRVPAVQSALSNFPTDVICLQEVWRPADRQAILATLRGSYPHVFEAPARQKFASQVPVCSFDDLEPVSSCLLQQCLFSDRGFTECAVAECRSALDVVARQNPECAGALFAQAGRSSAEISTIIEELFSSSSAAGLFAYDGSNGLILASRYELTDREVLDFFEESTTSHRVALLAKVSVNGVTHQIACTHLSSNLDGLVPYTGNSGSWQNEGRVQADLLIQASTASAQAQPNLLLGDFNCSLANGQTGVASDFAQNCERIITSGFRDPAGEELGCSFCTSNTLNRSNPEIAGTRDLLLDHIFTSNLVADPTQVELGLQQLVTIGGVQSNISDHYAVRIEIPVN